MDVKRDIFIPETNILFLIVKRFSARHKNELLGSVPLMLSVLAELNCLRHRLQDIENKD
jgi:hypothetical protein